MRSWIDRVVIKRSLMCCSIPLAIFFSCQSNHQTDSDRPDSLVTRMANKSSAPESRDPSTGSMRPTDEAPDRQTHSFEKTEITSMFLAHGLDSSAAATWTSYASCASGLNPLAYRWQKNERQTGLFLIPDSRRTSCGYGHLKAWQFRAQMQDAQSNVSCAAQLARRGWIPDSFSQCAAPVLAQGDSESRKGL